MTVVNKFNVNKQEVTLDADIIENMSANDVSYNSSLQYNENTVGDKLSELEGKLVDVEPVDVKMPTTGWGSGFNNNLEQFLTSYSVGLKIDVTEYKGCKVNFCAYGYCGFIMKDGSRNSVDNYTSHFNKPTQGFNTLDIPEGAENFCVTTGSNESSYTRFVQFVREGNESEISKVDEKVGNLNNLETENKDNIVNALNELKNNRSSEASKVSYNNDKSGIAVNNVQDAIDEVCADYDVSFNASTEMSVTAGTNSTSNAIDISKLNVGDILTISFTDGIYDILGRWGYAILQGKEKSSSNFVQINLVSYKDFHDFDLLIDKEYDAIRLYILSSQASASGNITISASMLKIHKSIITNRINQTLEENVLNELNGIQHDFETESQITLLNLDLKNGDILHYKVENLGGTSTLYSQLYIGNKTTQRNTLLLNLKTLSVEQTVEDDIVISGLTEEYNQIYFNMSAANDKAMCHFSIKKGLIERTEDLENAMNDVSLQGIEALKRHIELPLLMLKNKEVDETNRLVFAFNGDSIIGSQLDDITKCDTYDSGVFPPNLSKMIMARIFWEKYRFEDEDVVFRNLRHSDWQKTGFNIDKSASEITFNEFECYAPSASSDSATININVTKTTWIKVVYGYCDRGVLNISIKKNDSEYLTEKVGNNANDKRLYQYKIYKVESGSYTITITPDAENFADCRLWGCEWWSNPRLDVVVGAYSGSTATKQVEGMTDAWYGDNNKPALIVSDVLFINDDAYIKNGADTLSNWRKSVTTLDDIANNSGVPIVYFIYHNPTTPTLTGKYVKSLANLNDFRVIDMHYIYQNIFRPERWLREGDGLHLNNLGNQRYFEQLDKLFVE